jgi:hypothetical protein
MQRKQGTRVPRSEAARIEFANSFTRQKQIDCIFSEHPISFENLDRHVCPDLGFFQIFLIVFLLAVVSSASFYNATIGPHVIIGIAVVSLAFASFRMVNKTRCPDRIKRISKATAILAGVQAILGIILFSLIHLNASVSIQNVILLFHVVMPLTIIAQASSAAAPFDIWEEKDLREKRWQSPDPPDLRNQASQGKED